MKKLLTVMLVICSIFVLASCGKKLPQTTSQPAQSAPAQTAAPATSAPAAQPAAPAKQVEELTYAPGTTLRMATGYNSAKTGLFFDASVAKDGIDLAGVTYHTGELKPTWVEVQNKLGIKFENKYQGNSATNEFNYWKDRLTDVDMLSGKAAELTEYGEAGKIVNIAEYLDSMPNFKAYLEQNPIVRLSITGNTATGAIYFSPYFDGVNDIERMPLMRTDMVKKLLDGEGQFTASKCGKTASPKYTPYMPTSGKISVDVVNKDSLAVEKISKDYDAAGNIIAAMNAKGSIDGVEAVNMLRTYIDKAYNGYYGTQRSDLFIGQNAAWDADELVALLRCVVANAQTLNGTDQIFGLFSREDNNLQRKVDMFRFAGSLFGVRGLESRRDYLFVGTDGKLHDARMEKATYEAMERVHSLAEEGLISKSYLDNSDENTKKMLQNDLGFMHYDYNQTQTIYNNPAQKVLSEGEEYMAVMVPVARWYDGTDPNGVYMRFTESWRSVKDEAWGISIQGIAGDKDKLHACLKLIDFAYSEEGQILLSYGPDRFIKTKADGSYETFTFNGKQMPVIADVTYELLQKLTSGNYTNFARQYLGSTLSFVKSQAFEFQCTEGAGKVGAGHISTAIGLGTIKHPVLDVNKSNMWYTSVPTILPNTKNENDQINQYTEIGATTGVFSQNKGKTNYFVDQIISGYTHEGFSNADEAVKTVSETYHGKQNLALLNNAWNRLVKYYETAK